MKLLLAAFTAGWLSASGGHAVAQDLQAGIDAIRQGDYEAARGLLEPIAAKGDKYAQDLLGGMYLEGRGVQVDPSEAARWFMLAASQGYASSQYQLGVMYLEGRGVAQDPPNAARWFLLAAVQGIDAAQFNLAYMLSNGIGMAQDDAQAASWFMKAASQGHASAHNHLGAMYAKGTGLPQDFVTAHLHFNVACALGDEEGCSNRDTVSGLISLADISEAQRRARICMQSNYQDCGW